MLKYAALEQNAFKGEIEGEKKDGWYVCCRISHFIPKNNYLHARDDVYHRYLSTLSKVWVGGLDFFSYLFFFPRQHVFSLSSSSYQALDAPIPHRVLSGTHPSVVVKSPNKTLFEFQMKQRPICFGVGCGRFVSLLARSLVTHTMIAFPKTVSFFRSEASSRLKFCSYRLGCE